MLAYQAHSVGDDNRAIVLAEEGLTIAREIGIQDSLLWAFACLGQVHWLRRNFTRARAAWEGALRLSPGDLNVIYNLGWIAEDEGDYDRAEALYQKGLSREEPPASWDIVGHVYLAQVARKRGDQIRARRLFEEGLAFARQNGMECSIYWILHGLAELDWLDGESALGSARLAESLRVAQKSGHRQLIARGLLVAANRACVNGNVVRAIRLFGAADLLVPHYLFEVSRFDLGEYTRSMERTRSAFAPEAFAAAWAEGQAMTAEQAVAYALDEDYA